MSADFAVHSRAQAAADDLLLRTLSEELYGKAVLVVYCDGSIFFFDDAIVVDWDDQKKTTTVYDRSWKLVVSRNHGCRAFFVMDILMCKKLRTKD